MLTINAKTKDGTLEDIYEVERVAARSTNPDTGNVMDVVDIVMPDQREFTLAGVDIFVMNKDGNTIAKYILPRLPEGAPVTNKDIH